MTTRGIGLGEFIVEIATPRHWMGVSQTAIFTKPLAIEHMTGREGL